MVFLKTDTGEFRELLVPSIVSIGRATSNDIRPQNQSVSKSHAQIVLSYVPGTSKVEAWLEDLNSSYGTYAGETPLEIERVKGKIKLYFGFYMRFGHAPNYFQYLEKIPADAEVLRPEIIVSPTKDFQKKVEEFAFKESPQLYQPNNQPNQQPPQPRAFQVQQPLAGQVPLNMDGSGVFSQGSVAPPVNNFSSGEYGSRPATAEPHPSHSRSRNRHDSFDVNGDDDEPRNMQISVNYPTSNRHSPQHPVTIHIDSASAGPGSGTGRDFSRGRGSAGDRYSSSPDRTDLRGSARYSDEYDRGDYSSADYGGPNSRFERGRENTGGSQNRVNWIDDAYGAHGTNDRVAFEDSFEKEVLDSPPRSQSYNRSNAIHAQHKGIMGGNYDNVSSSINNHNEHSRGSAVGHSGSFSKQGKPKTVFESISALNTLTKRAIGQQSNKVGKSNTAEDSAMHSLYYQQNQKHLRHSSDPRNSASLPRGILKPTKQADFQSRVGDNGIIMEAVNPSHTVLVRRSWPEELLAPSSELIAGFVDILLAQEAGTTEKEFALYKDIFVGKAKDKNAKIKLPPAGPDGEMGDLSKVPILSVLKMNPVKCDLPVVLPDAVMSEAVAETILDSDSTATGLIGSTIQELNNLLRQCLLGTNIDGSVLETSVDFDHALQGVITSILKHAIAQLMCAQQSNVIVALESGKNKTGMDVRSNVGLLIQQSIDSLTRINSFMNGTYLQEETTMLRPHHVYEIGALALSGILNKLDACNVTVWSIGQRADEVTIEHVVNKSAGFLKASLSLELEELRKLKKDSDLTPLVDRIRQQETNILERKILRFHKVFEIILGFNMRSAFWEWRTNARALKRHEMQLMDLTDRCGTNTKRQFFKVWLQKYRTTHAFKKTLRRFGRIIGWKGCNQVRKYMNRWRSMVDRSKQYNESGVEIARLRNELCNLKAVMHDLTNKDELAASLAAERSLNRELASINQELRFSMQQQQEKILEIGGAPSGKRKDLVYHYLIGKEEELAEARRENKFLHSELDHLRILAARRLQPAPKGRILPAPPVGNKSAGSGGYKPVSLLRDDGPLNRPIGVRSGPSPQQPHYVGSVSSQRAAGAAVAPTQLHSQRRYDPSHNKTVMDSPNSVAFMMNKDEAKIVILSEVRRLRESHTALQESRNQLNNKMIEETNRNVQLTMATQSMQTRLTAMERSANALRQILRQKLGDQGIVHMMESLENLGAGSNALLEVPVAGTAEVVAANVVDHTPYSYEAKHPESPRPAGSALEKQPGVASYYLEPHSYPSASSAQDPRARGNQPYASTAGTGNHHHAGRQVGGPELTGESNPYGKAIESAMYGRK